MTSNPKVSIIIPVFNVEEHINACISSALSQTYSDLEVVIVDDGSTDKSVQICGRLVEGISYAHLLHKDNGGLSSARNYGLKHANGDYVFFLDGDDVIDAQTIENMVNMLELNDVSLVSAHLGKTAKDEVFHGSISNKGEIVSGVEQLKKMLLLEGETGSACGKLFVRSCFDEVQFPEGQLFEDFGVMAAIFSKSPRIFSSQSVVYGYTTRPGSITGSSDYDLAHIEGMEASLATVKSVVFAKHLELVSELNCFEAFCRLRVASKVSTEIMRDNTWAKEYVELTKKVCRRVACNDEVSLMWRIRCALFGFSFKLYRLTYKLYGRLSGKVVG